MAQRVKLLPGMWETRGSIPESGRSAGEGNGKPTPVLLPGEPHGGRSLIGYSPWGRKESDTIERLYFTSHVSHYKVLTRVPCAIP